MLSHHATMEAQAEPEGKEDVAVYRQHQVLHPRAAEFKEEAELGIRLTERALHIIDPLSSAADECVFTQTERGRMLREHHHKEPRGKKHVSKQVRLGAPSQHGCGRQYAWARGQALSKNKCNMQQPATKHPCTCMHASCAGAGHAGSCC